MFLLILGFISLLTSIVLFYQSNQIKVQKNKQQQSYKYQLQKNIEYLKTELNNLNERNEYKKQNIEKELLDWQEKRKSQITYYIELQRQHADEYVQKSSKLANDAITEINKELQTHKVLVQQQKQQIQQEIDKMRASLSAGVQARLREQKIKEQQDFYKLQIEESDLADVKMLQNLKTSFHKPVVLSKLIWTQYFQKQMTELCDRVLGKKIVCGIYKITNLLTEQCYIGQSVNIADRWKQHCKCGLGIEASSTNLLYKAMQKDGVWNFTFELLEECSRQLLNEKEAFWINMYQSNNFGYNLTKGNLK